MEDTLRVQTSEADTNQWQCVLILVLMEDTLRDIRKVKDFSAKRPS